MIYLLVFCCCSERAEYVRALLLVWVGALVEDLGGVLMIMICFLSGALLIVNITSYIYNLR